MRKETADQYAQGLQQRNSLPVALKIAKSCMDGSHVSRFVNLPVGPVFHTKSYGSNNWNFKDSHLKSLHAFWKQVYHILLKREKNEFKK